MRKPMIAITPRFKTEDNVSWMKPEYLECLGAAGALPVILSCNTGAYSIEDIPELVSQFDGFLFSGGTDLHPELYGEERLDCCGEIIPERDRLEIPLCREVVRQNKPMLGICRGSQVLNVALGGSLYQDIPSQLTPPVSIGHLQEKPYTVTAHPIKVLPGTPLYDMVQQDRIEINSVHHQGMKRLAPGLVPMAEAEDGIIEALYHTEKKFVMGVQWHPELLGMGNLASEQIFRAFVQACASK